MPAFVAYEHVAFELGVMGQALGAAALLAQSKSRGLVAASPLAARAAFQARLGVGEIRLRTVRAGAFELFEAAWSLVAAGGTLSRRQQAELRSIATHATETAVEIVTGLFRAAGAAPSTGPACCSAVSATSMQARST
jgi:indole-3-acetate monooxygenase